jgi:hypothetical protein
MTAQASVRSEVRMTDPPDGSCARVVRDIGAAVKLSLEPAERID